LIDWYKANRLVFDYQRKWVYRYVWDTLGDEIEGNYRQSDPIDIVPRRKLKVTVKELGGDVADLGLDDADDTDHTDDAESRGDVADLGLDDADDAESHSLVEID
jgi:hypothetical protein